MVLGDFLGIFLLGVPATLPIGVLGVDVLPVAECRRGVRGDFPRVGGSNLLLEGRGDIILLLVLLVMLATLPVAETRRVGRGDLPRVTSFPLAMRWRRGDLHALLDALVVLPVAEVRRDWRGDFRVSPNICLCRRGDLELVRLTLLPIVFDDPALTSRLSFFFFSLWTDKSSERRLSGLRLPEDDLTIFRSERGGDGGVSNILMPVLDL